MSELSSAERDKLPGSAFCDPKNRKFPVLDCSDVSDAWHLAGHAENPDAVRRCIIRKAKRMGCGLSGSMKEWADQHYVGESELTRALYPTVRSVDDVHDVIIMTENPVRQRGGIARVAGAELTAYARNPVVMWAHDYNQPPIGRTVEIAAQGSSLRARFEFAPDGAFGLADTVRRLWEAGFLNGASIGFAPLEPPEMTDLGPVFNRWELYEFSIVPIPMDRDALRIVERGLESAREVEPHVERVEAALVLEFLQLLRGRYQK